MAVVFKNNAKTTLASGLTSSATSVTVADGSAFPSLSGGDTFFCTFDNGTNVEVVKVTARSSNTLTIVRAQDDTTARAFSTGAVAELRLTAGILNLFSQTGVAITDEIEAYLDANGTTFPDNIKAQFGTNNDLQIYSTGSFSYIKELGTGGLYLDTNGDGIYLRGTTGNKNMVRAIKDGAVTLYHDGDIKAATTSTGIDVTGVITTDGLTTSADINFGDNDKAIFGAGSDLKIYHDGADNHIIADTSNLNIQVVGGGSINLGDKFGNTLLQVNDNADVKLFHGIAPAEKLATTSTGIDVTGSINSGAITSTGTLDTSGKITITNSAYDNHLRIVRSGQGDLSLTPSANQLLLGGGGFSPAASNADDLGRTDKYWQDLWLGSTLKMSGTTVLDSSRNLTNIGTISSGAITSTISGTSGNLITLNNSNGEIGSIETQGDEMVLMSVDRGLRIRTSAVNSIIPVGTARTNLDATIDLGSTGARFKDLYLSGTISSGAITSSDKVKGASLETDRYIYHAGDTNTYIDFGTDEINFHAGGGANLERAIVNSSGLTVKGDLSLPNSASTIKFTGTTGPFGLEFGDTEANPNFRIYYRTTPNTLTFEDSGENVKHTFALTGNYTSAGAITSGTTITSGGDMFVGNQLNINGGSTNSINFTGTGTDTVARKFAYETNADHYVTNRHTDGDLVLMSNNGTGGGETVRIRIQSGSGTQDIDITNANLDLNSNNIKGVGTINSGAITSTGEVEATALDINGNGDISGNLTLGGYLAGPATFTIDPAAVGNNTGTVVIAGNLQVDGTTTTVNSTTVNVSDKAITLGYDATTDAANNNAGIVVYRPETSNAQFLWSETNERFEINRKLNIGQHFTVDASGTNETKVEIGAGTASNHYAYIDLIGDATYTDYGLRIIRNNSGANTSSVIYHRGTGNFDIETQEAAAIRLRTAGATALTIDSSQDATFSGTIDSGAINITTTGSGDVRHFLIDGADGNYDFRTNSTSGYTTTFNMDNTGLEIGHNSSGRNLALRTNSLDRLTISGSGTFDFNSNNLQSIGTIDSGAINTTGAVTIDVDNQAGGALRIEANQTNPDNDFYFAQEIVSTLSGTTATTADREQGGLYLDINSTATGGDTSNEHRAYGVYVDLDSTGDADLIAGGYFNATATPTAGQTTEVIGIQAIAEDNGGAGAVNNVYGAKLIAQSDNSTSDTNLLYGSYSRVTNLADSGAITKAIGVYGEVELASGSGDIYGTTYVIESQYDNNTGISQTHTSALFFGNYSGELPTTAYGVYIPDAVRNRFDGSITTGRNSTTTASYGFNSDLNTGMYSPADHELGFLTNGGQRLKLDSTGATVTGTLSSGAITSTGNSQFDGNLQVGDTVQQNSYGLLQVNQEANNDESGIGIMSSGAARSMRLWTDETNSYINSGNGGSGNLIFNEAITVSSGGNLTGVGTIDSGAITSTGNLLLDSASAEINLKSGIGTESGAVNWTFNTTGTNYASIKLPYDTRATTGLHIDSGYPITIDATTRINFAISGNTRFRITNTDFEVGTTPIIDLNRNLTNIGTISSGAITSTGTSEFASLNLGGVTGTGSTYLSGTQRIVGDGYIATQAIYNYGETGTSPAAIVFGNGATYGNDQISLVTSGVTALYIDSSQNITVAGTVDGRDLAVDGTKLDGIATGATNTAAPFYTSAIASSDVTTALGYTPYQESTALSATTGVFSSDVNIDNELRLDARYDGGSGDNVLAFKDSGGEYSIRHNVNDGNGNYSMSIGYSGAGNGEYAVTGDGVGKILMGGHGREGSISLNAAPTGTAGNDISFSMGLLVDQDRIAVGASSDGTGLDADAGTKVFDASANAFATSYSIGTQEVITNARNLTNIGTINSGTIASTGLTVTKTTQTDIASFVNNNGSIVLGHYGGGSQIDLGSNIAFRIRQGSAIPFSINTSGNATFAGTISSGAITATTTSGTALNVNSGTTNVTSTFESGDATAWINLKDSNSSTYGAMLGAEGGLFRLRTNNNDANTDLTVDTSGNLSVSGTISSGAISANGGTVQHEFTSSSDGPLITKSTDATSGLGFTDDSATNYLFYRGSLNHFYFNSGTVGIGIASAGSGQSLNVGGGIGISSTTVIDSSRNLTNIAKITGNSSSGGVTTFNVGRGDVYFESNSLSNANGAGITLRTSSNPTANTDGCIFDVRSSGQAARLWVGQDLTSAGYNNFYVGNLATGGEGTPANYEIELNATSGNITAQGNITAYGTVSDIRQKENIVQIDKPIERLEKIKGITFNYKKKSEDERLMGVIAQDLLEDDILKLAVYEQEDFKADDDDPLKNTYGVRYEHLTAILIEAIKEQQKEIEYMKSEIKTLKENNNGN